MDEGTVRVQGCVPGWAAACVLVLGCATRALGGTVTMNALDFPYAGTDWLADEDNGWLSILPSNL